MIGIILAAGDGKRLKNSKNESCCKPLTKINEKSLISFALDNLVQLNINEAYIVIGKEGALIKKAMGNEYNGIKLNYVSQQEQKGLMNAFVQALNVVDCDETIVLQLSDEIFIDLKTEDIKNMVKAEKADFYCGVTPEDNPEKIKNNFSVESDSNSFLVKCTEKPKIVTSNTKGTGFTIFSDQAQKIIRENPDKFIDLCDCFNDFVASGYRGLVFTVAEREFNINTVEDLTEAEIFLNK